MMMDVIVNIKDTCTALTATWGWVGWLIFGLMLCMGLDYLTGSAAALRTGKWSSSAARDGIWHKVGTIAIVSVCYIMDGILRVVAASGSLPMDYTVFFGPMVTVWCLLTEVGSIVENAGKLGAPIPPWLAKAVEAIKDQVDGSDMPSKD